MILAATCVLWGFASENFAAVLNYVDLTNASKNALERMSREIRNARSVSSCSATQLVLLDLDGNEVKFTYDPGGKALTQAKSGRNTTLLTGCDSLRFSALRRKPAAGSYELLPLTNLRNCKVVQVQWACSRRLSGSRQNTERQVCAKVVLRNP
jgi:hypothetical protein